MSGTSVSDSAALTGAKVAAAGGTVTYSAFSDAACNVSAGSPTTVTVTNGLVPDSNPVTLSTPGTYYWVASYSGDSANAASTSPCGSEAVTVTPPPTVIPTLAPRAPIVLSSSAPTVVSSTGAAFSGSVNPEGLPTTAYFQYGLDARYSSGGGLVYDHSTPAQQVGSDFSNHPASASVSGLLPNALYHVRLVATNSDGTTYGADQTFTTQQDPPPPPPVLGKFFDAKPVSGVVLVKLPSGKASDRSVASAALTKGQGFVPLTEARQLPTGTQIDARQGSLQVIAAAALRRGKLQTGVFGGGLFKLTQARRGLTKGLTTLALLEGAFRGAPSYASCKAHHAGDPPNAHAALSRQILQALHASVHGRFRTRGRYSAATVRGTVWDTIDRCDGTLTIVHRGTVLVTDFVRRKTIAVHARHSYLARAITRPRK